MVGGGRGVEVYIIEPLSVLLPPYVQPGPTGPQYLHVNQPNCDGTFPTWNNSEMCFRNSRPELDFLNKSESMGGLGRQDPAPPPFF